MIKFLQQVWTMFMTVYGRLSKEHCHKHCPYPLAIPEAEAPNTLATLWEELIPYKRPWCWERLKAGGEEDDRGWGGWMASPTRSTWIWASSRSWWWTGKPGVLQSMGWQRVRHDWVNWTDGRLGRYRKPLASLHWEDPWVFLVRLSFLPTLFFWKATIGLLLSAGVLDINRIIITVQP